MTPSVRSSHLVQVFLRSFMLQSAWNYRTLQGTGMAWVILPVLRAVHPSREALTEAVGRHAGSFNAHPYLALLAVGSLCKLEAEGASPETIRRFRVALGGPLGALGDRLVWAAWLPLCAVVAVCLFLAGLSPVPVLLVFLLLYNVGHLVLRFWGFREGWRSGAELAARLRTMGLSRVADRLEGWLSGALGVLVGLALAAPAIRGELTSGWGMAGLVVVGAGIALGPRIWRPTAVVTVMAVGAIVLAGVFI